MNMVLLTLLAYCTISLGIVLTVLGWKGRLLDTRPYCRRCGYERAHNSRICSECGRTLALGSEEITFAMNHPILWRLRGSTRCGRRQKLARPLAAGICTLMLGLAIAGSGIWAESSGFDWIRVRTTASLIRDASDEPPGSTQHTRALTELTRRLQAGTLNTRHLVAANTVLYAESMRTARTTQNSTWALQPIAPAAKDYQPTVRAQSLPPRPASRIDRQSEEVATLTVVPHHGLHSQPSHPDWLRVESSQLDSDPALPVPLLPEQEIIADTGLPGIEGTTASRPSGRLLRASMSDRSIAGADGFSSEFSTAVETTSFSKSLRDALGIEHNVSLSDSYGIPDYTFVPQNQWKPDLPSRNRFSSWQSRLRGEPTVQAISTSPVRSGHERFLKPRRYSNAPLAQPVRNAHGSSKSFRSRSSR